MKRSPLFLASVLGLFLEACSDAKNDATQLSQMSDAERGRAVYVANCVACHNNDPAKNGPIGPELKGSTKELLEARVLSIEYPPNYKPKRDTKIMPKFPFLKDDIPYLTAYLNQ